MFGASRGSAAVSRVNCAAEAGGISGPMNTLVGLSLAAVQIDQANFHALINYSAASSAIDKPTSVFIGPEMPPASAAQLILLTAALPLEAPKIASNAGSIVLTSDYTWVETTFDGYNIWINGVK